MSEETVPAVVAKFDGIDGCGKTTLINAVLTNYENRFRVFCTKEFGSTSDIPANIGTDDISVSQLLRTLAKSSEYKFDDIERELLWAIASRRTNRIVIPQHRYLHDLILVDRSNLGNLAYGAVLNDKLKVVYELITSPIEIYDIIFWIDTPVETCNSRLQSRSMDIIEQKGIGFFTQVRDQYTRLCSVQPRILRLDGTNTLPQLVDQVRTVIDSLLLNRSRSTSQSHDLPR